MARPRDRRHGRWGRCERGGGPALAAAVAVAILAAALGGAPAPAAAAPAPAPAAPPPPAHAGSAERFAIDPAASQVAYHVGETFFENNRFTTAVGITHGVEGDIYIDRVHPAQSRVGPITVDISQFTSDSARRDRAIRRRWLESAKYPQAVFTPAAIEGLPQSYTEGRDIPVAIAGTLRVRDAVRPVTFKGTVRLQGDVLTGRATATILMTDFGFDPPSILGFLRAENQVMLEFQFTARRAPAVG
jgi:polyisoprenoid-binding protein YceI